MSIPAFPGALGWGANTPGGRGGKVMEVTTLDDGGAGSFREAIEASGPRIIVPRVGGDIILLSKLIAINPFITIAGQTAPGGGITLRSDPSYKDGTFTIATHDVIGRYFRVRTGRSNELASSRDGISVASSKAEVYNVILDHCSISWAADENLSTWYDAHDITFQWCIISEGLHDSSHEKGPHSTGVLLGASGSRNISVHHNLFAHNNSRNPRIATGGMVDVVNNLIYNPGGTGGWGPSHVSNERAAVPVNYVGNYYKLGVDSGTLNYYISGGAGPSNGPPEIYVKGNITPLRPTDDLDEAQGVVRPAQIPWVVPTRHSAPLIAETSAFEAYDAVLASAGATLPMRDAVDERIVNDVINGTGQIIDDPSDVGGWPVLEMGTPLADSDMDGMPDEWETARGLDPDDPADGQQIRPSGYSNVELFLNGGREMSVVTDLQQIETDLRAQVLELSVRADEIAQAIINLQAVDDALDAAADVIEAD